MPRNWLRAVLSAASLQKAEMLRSRQIIAKLGRSMLRPYRCPLIAAMQKILRYFSSARICFNSSGNSGRES
jgi:hypothetical protein